jgi:hypothetical protein
MMHGQKNIKLTRQLLISGNDVTSQKTRVFSLHVFTQISYSSHFEKACDLAQVSKYFLIQLRHLFFLPSFFLISLRFFLYPPPSLSCSFLSFCLLLLLFVSSYFPLLLLPLFLPLRQRFFIFFWPTVFFRCSGFSNLDMKRSALQRTVTMKIKGKGLQDEIQGDSVGTRPKKMRISCRPLSQTWSVAFSSAWTFPASPLVSHEARYVVIYAC